jgi:16S rRNA (cytosine1407-C5)-methyltransferase
MCAAPGGKTTQLCNNNPESIVRANEPSHSRIKALGFNLQRMQCANAILTQIPGERFGTLFPETFDAILLDAPCSGEGTNFKSDFSFKYWKKENIKRTAGIQFQLLQSAFKATKPGGIIVYSTCTLNPIENEDNVERILQRAQ